MTVKDFKAELEFYDEDAEVIFEVQDDIDVESTTTDKYGRTSVYVDKELKPTFISEIGGHMRIELGVAE